MMIGEVTRQFPALIKISSQDVSFAGDQVREALERLEVRKGGRESRFPARMLTLG
jgi:hypothetical protein